MRVFSSPFFYLGLVLGGWLLVQLLNAIEQKPE